MNLIAAIALGLILARLAAELALLHLNRRHVLAHSTNVPPVFAGFISSETYAKTVDYTLARSRVGEVEMFWDTAILILVVFTGVLPAAFYSWASPFGDSAWAMSGFLLAVGIGLSVPGMPFDWYRQFHLEQRFGFNTQKPRLWWIDRLKGLCLSVALGWPVLALLLKIVEWAGQWWWLWGWGAMMTFQFVLLLLAPVLILPLFNKFSPLPEGPLRERLLELARRTGFITRGVQVMDGSKRSRHSNAFFTGFGRFRKIVLFDTLIQQLTEPELEAVLAHEIGHYKKRHIPKMMAGSALLSLGGFYALYFLSTQPWFYRAFGFEPGNPTPAFLLMGLLSGALTFWFSPLAHVLSRRYEYQADAFAAEAVGTDESLVGALRKLTEKNLSNLTPHPLYSRIYYSHPTLLEREEALARWKAA